MSDHIFAFITCDRVKWEESATKLAEAEGVEPDEIRQRYSVGWHVDGRTGAITYDDDGNGDYSPADDTIRLEEPVEESGWIDRSWSPYVLEESRNDVRPEVDADADSEELADDVRDALGWLEGGYFDNGDGTFYASESYKPAHDNPEGWTYSYALHFVRKYLGPKGWTETEWHPVKDGGIEL